MRKLYSKGQYDIDLSIQRIKQYGIALGFGFSIDTSMNGLNVEIDFQVPLLFWIFAIQLSYPLKEKTSK